MQSLNFVLEKKRKPQLPSRFPWFVWFTGREFKTSTLYLLLRSSLCSTFCSLCLFFSCPSSPPETAGIQLSVCVDCTSHHAATHTHTQAHTGLSPPPPISDRHRPSVTSKQHRGHCVGEHQHARFHHWLCSDTHTHMHTYSCVRILHTCAGGINAYSHRSVHPNLLAYTHTHTLTAIIRSPYLKIRGNSENKASSKAEWGRETWKEGREEWAGVAGRGGESMPMEQRE